MRKLVTVVIFASIFLLQIIESFGQTREISGTILNAETNEPIPNIKITVKGTKIFTKSNNKGKYSLSVPDTIRTITFSDFFTMNVTEIKFISSYNIDIYLSEKDLFDLTLEELMQIEVVSSTKSSITIQKAPATIKLFTKEDFELYGFSTLTDVLNTIPGMQIQEHRIGFQSIWVRGVQQRYNSKMLLLIDKIPIRDNFYGNFYIDESVPLETIEKIEVISGPGSVLYGTNSFSGVINITTKSKGKSVSAKYGTYNSAAGSVDFDYKGLYINANMFQSDGFSPELNRDGKVYEHDQAESNKSALVKYSVNTSSKSKLSFLGHYGRHSSPYKFQKSKKSNTFILEPIYGSIKYNHDFSEKGNLNTSVYYNYMKLEKTLTQTTDTHGDTLKKQNSNFMNTAILGADIDYSVKKGKNTLTVGSSFLQDRALRLEKITTFDEKDTLYTGNVAHQSDIVRNDIGFFLQEMYEISPEVLFIGGLRYDLLSNFDNQFNYRFGITGQSKQNIYGKILYGTAYRTPSYREYLDDVSYNLSLQPEHLSTFEVQGGYTFKKGDVNITYFNNTYSDFIQDILVDSIQETAGMRILDDEMAFNFDKRNTSGLEIKTTLYPIKGLFVNLGASYLLTKSENLGSIPVQVYPIISDEGVKDLTFLSDYTFNVNTSYRFFGKYLLGINANYFSDRATPENYQSKVPEENQNFENANGFYKIDAFAKLRFWKKLDINFKVSNLLNEKIFSPNYGGNKAYDTEWEGRTLSVGVRYRFN